VEYIDIKIPGNRNSGVCRPAKPRDIQRFPRHYQAFKNRVEGEEDKIEGTLLAEWPVVTRSMVEELAFYNVKTVEQLANMSDSNSQQFMGMTSLKIKAQQWLDAAKEQKAATELQSELDKRDEQIAAMQAQIEELMAAQKAPKAKRKKAAPKAKEPDNPLDEE